MKRLFHSFAGMLISLAVVAGTLRHCSCCCSAVSATTGNVGRASTPTGRLHHPNRIPRRLAKRALKIRGGARESAKKAKAGGGKESGGMNRLRDAVFPIYGRQETGKFLALGGIQFFIIFVLTLTRDLKDTLIITSCGAEAISFLKVCVLSGSTVGTIDAHHSINSSTCSSGVSG